MAGRRVHFVMPDELVERIDAACPEGVSRGEFVRRAVEQALSEAKGLAIDEQADPQSRSLPAEEGVRSAAPAEQPVHEFVPASTHEALVEAAKADDFAHLADVPVLQARARMSSSQAKRDVRPVPKKG